MSLLWKRSIGGGRVHNKRSLALFDDLNAHLNQFFADSEVAAEGANESPISQASTVEGVDVPVLHLGETSNELMHKKNHVLVVSKFSLWRSVVRRETEKPASHHP